MNQESDFDYLYPTGTVRGIEFQIGVRADPSLDNTDSFAVILFFEKGDGTVVEVAKVDDTQHREGTVHVDRYYREVGAPDKDFDVEIETFDEAERYLRERWERFAGTYLDTHGAEQRGE